MATKKEWTGLVYFLITAAVVLFGFVYYFDHRFIVVEDNKMLATANGTILTDTNKVNKKYQFDTLKENNRHEEVMSKQNENTQKIGKTGSFTRTVTNFIHMPEQVQQTPQVQSDNSWRGPLDETNKRVGNLENGVSDLQKDMKGVKEDVRDTKDGIDWLIKNQQTPKNNDETQIIQKKQKETNTTDKY